MRILAVEHAIPGERVTTEDIAVKLRTANAKRIGHDAMEETERRMRRFLEKAGSGVKYRVSGGERAIDLLLRVTRSALEEAGVERDAVDFVVYTGVARGWMEPATANVVQGELGLRNATCFDVLDGCAGWLRSLHVAWNFMRAGTYRCGLLVNCEAGVERFQKWQYEEGEDVEPFLATYTIGEAATATVVTADPLEDDFYFRFDSFGEHFDLCMVPLPTIQQFLPRSRMNGQIPGKFFANSDALLRIGVHRIVETFESDARLRSGKYDIAFGHAASEKVGAIVSSRLGIPAERYYSTHRAFGNTITASIPLAMSLAAKDGQLSRGDNVLIVAAASGITVGFATFTY